MKAAGLPREQLVKVARGLGIPDSDSYGELVERVERWPTAADRKARPLRRRAGDALALALVTAWLGMTGAFVAGMKLVGILEGRK